MNIVLNVKGRKQIRLLFQVQVSNTAFAKKMLLNLESILLRKRAKLKLTHYMGKQIRTLQNMRMLRHVSLSYVIHNKTLHLSLALKSSSAAFLQEVMNVSMGERKAFSQANSAKMINLSKKQHALFHIDFSNLRQLIKQQRRLRHDGRMILKWLSNKIGAAVEIAYINGSFQFQVKVK